jgi:hypothetical protein
VWSQSRVCGCARVRVVRESGEPVKGAQGVAVEETPVAALASVHPLLALPVPGAASAVPISGRRTCRHRPAELGLVRLPKY